MMTLEQIGQKAKEAEPLLRVMNGEKKNQVLLRAAEYLVKDTEFILSANETDMENGRERGMKEGLLDRLKLTKERIEGMAEGLRQIAALPDPIGGVISEWTPENGLDIRKVRVSLGVIGIIYEARPNVTADAFGLCFKTGNPVVLRGRKRRGSFESGDCGSAPEGSDRLRLPRLRHSASGGYQPGDCGCFHETEPVHRCADSERKRRAHCYCGE